MSRIRSRGSATRKTSLTRSLGFAESESQARESLKPAAFGAGPHTESNGREGIRFAAAGER
jgi:hypothetical protein